MEHSKKLQLFSTHAPQLDGRGSLRGSATPCCCSPRCHSLAAPFLLPFRSRRRFATLCPDCALPAAPFCRPRRAPSRILWRTVRGMIPHKTPRGAAALERLKAFEGVPAPYDKVRHAVLCCACCGLLWSAVLCCRVGLPAMAAGCTEPCPALQLHMWCVCPAVAAQQACIDG